MKSNNSNKSITRRRLSNAGSNSVTASRSQGRLPVLDLASYYKRVFNNQCESSTMLHAPVSRQNQDACEPESRATKFISFQSIREHNIKQLACSPSEELVQNVQNQQEAYKSYYEGKEQPPAQQPQPSGNSYFLRLNQTFFNSRGQKSESSEHQIDFELTHNKMIFTQLQGNVEKSHNLQKDKWDKELAKQSLAADIQRTKIRFFPKQSRSNQSLYAPMQEHKPAMRVVREQQNDPRHPTSIFFLPHNQAFWTTPLQDHPPWKPEFREMSSWAVCGRKSYLFAGIGMEVMGDLTEISSDGSEFSKLPQCGDIPQNRYAHSILGLPYPVPISASYQSLALQKLPPVTSRMLLLFGGEMRFNSQLKLRECLNDTRIFNLDSKEWKLLRPNLDQMPEARRSFGNCFAGKGLVIHGGLTSRSLSLNDLHFLNLTNCKWSPVAASNDPFPQGLAYHTLLCVYSKPMALRIGVTAPLQDKPAASNKKLKVEGLYCLGGCFVNSKTKSQDFYPHFLAVLKIELVPPQWTQPETTGITPEPRMLHSATHMPLLNCISVFAGRNDSLKSPYLNDTYLLTLDTLTWIKVESLGSIPKARAGHSAICCDSKLLVLGGLSLEGYIANSIEIAEFDRVKVRFQIDELRKIPRMPDAPEQQQQQQKQQLQPPLAPTPAQHKPSHRYIEPPRNEQQPIAQQIEKLKFQNFSPLIQLPQLK